MSSNVKKHFQKTLALSLAALSIASTGAYAAEVPKLWGINVSPYVRKVQVAMAEKNIPYELKETLPKILNDALAKESAKEFLNASPLGKIPALEYQGHQFADSAVIVAYLDKKFSKQSKSLYPTNPELYARALWFENYGDHVLGAVATKKILVENFVKPHVLKTPGDQTIVLEAINQELPIILAYLEQEVTQNIWLAGPQFSIADIAIATHFVSLKQAGYELDAKQWPHLSTYLQRVFARDSFKKHLA